MTITTPVPVIGSTISVAGFGAKVVADLEDLDDRLFDIENNITDWANYTATVTNGGTATYSTQLGRWRRVGPKHVDFRVYLVVNNAGSGAGTISVALPTTPIRTYRHIFATVGENAAYYGAGITLTSGSGAIIDRIRNTSGTNLTGADLTAGRIMSIQGDYEEL
jgi:hypothetical protein